jgi:uncharacterized repeat protein (TIGR02543 family)
VANLQSTDVTEDTVSLKWKKQSGVSGYQVTCFDAKGNKLKSYSTTKGSYTVESLSPKTEYQFKVRSYVLQDDGTKLYGAYSAQLAVTTLTNKYTIQFNGNGSTSGSTAAMKNRTTGKTYTLTANGFKRKGYTFTGWNTKADGSGKSYADKASVKTLTTGGKTKTLYAQWKKTKYTITYELNGGVNNESNPATYTITTKSFALKNPTKKGYTFVGWYSDDTYKNKVTEITKGSTGKKTLYAKWKANKYTIQFDGNGSTGGKMESMTDCKYATSYELNANKFKRTGYEFVGWNTKADGTGTSYSDGEAVKKLSSKSGGTVTLYAQWQEIQETEEPQE